MAQPPPFAVLTALTVLTLAAAAAPAFAAHRYGKPPSYWSRPDEQEPTPRFEDTPTDIRALVGQTVILPCHVADRGDKVVSWIRSRDLHILTSDVHTFTSDGRFGVLHQPRSSAWNLRVMGAQPADQGRYECQVNTDPKMNRAVFLSIRGNEWPKDRPAAPEDAEIEVPADPAAAAAAASGGPGSGPGRGGERPAAWEPRRAHVLGSSEQFVSQGSTVTFTCVVSAPYPRGLPPHTVVWLHAGRLLSIQAERGGISMDTVTTEAQTSSRLTVAQVGPADAGNYTCAPSGGVQPASVALVVTDGERTEAMQRDGPHSGAAPKTATAVLGLAPTLALLLGRRRRPA